MKNTTLLLTATLLLTQFTGFGIDKALKMRITSTSNSYYDEAVVRFIDGATEGFDSSYDAWKMFSTNPDVPAFYTKIPDGDLAVNALPDLTKDYQVDLYYKVSFADTYLIEMEELGPFPANTDLLLLDLETGNTYTYADFPMNLVLPENDGSTIRFRLVFSTPPQANTQNISCYDAGDGILSVADSGNHDWSYQLFYGTTMVDSGSNVNETLNLQGLNSGNYSLITAAYGITDTLGFSITEPDPVISSFSASSSVVYLSGNTDVQFYNASSGASDFQWSFGNGNTSSDHEPLHTYGQTGEYTVQLVATEGNCTDTSELNITVKEFHWSDATPAPVKAIQYVRFKQESNDLLIQPEFSLEGKFNYTVINTAGQVVISGNKTAYNSEVRLELPGSLKKGIYFVNLLHQNRAYSSSFLVQ